MAARVSDPLLKFPKPAFRQARLTDFATGKPDLQIEHQSWLNEAASAIPGIRDFTIYIFGYASKLGFRGEDPTLSTESNKTLSFNRANEVARFMERKNPRVTTRIDRFLARGNQDYSASATDDSYLWRAVEVHVFLGDPPPPPRDVEPPHPCPGGQRYRKWSIATPGGFSATVLPGAVAAGNLVAFRREEGHQLVHFYVVPGVGGGFSFSLPKLQGLWEILKQFFGGLSVSGMSWQPFTAVTPFNFGDLNGANCEIRSAGAGAGPGVQLCFVSVSGQVWFRESSGKCMFATRDFCTNVNTSGKGFQFGAGASVVGGALIKIH